MGNFCNKKFTTFQGDYEQWKDQNEAKNCKVSASQVVQGKKIGNVTINYD